MLDNGQVLRLFIDQSDAGHPAQIIQHWNHVYGYTAHHLAMRATRLQAGARVAVTLDEMIEALSNRGIGIMEATGYYTEGLLLQVFTRPERAARIPEAIKEFLAAYGAGTGAGGSRSLVRLASEANDAAPVAFAGPPRKPGLGQGLSS